jgi:hypothetical protein
MLNLMDIGLKAQKLTVDANHRVTDKEAHAIKDSGLRLVHKPDNKNQKITQISEARAKRDFVEPLDAA